MPTITKPYKNNIRAYLAGRTLANLAIQLGVSRQSLVYYVGGHRRPHSLRMPEFLSVLGEPWGRTLNISEVWPDETS